MPSIIQIFCRVLRSTQFFSGMLLKVFPILVWIYTFFACETKPDYNFTQQGKASYYARYFQGKRTASGELFHADSLTAAHRHLPLGTEVIVTNLKNGHAVKVKINDRGPFVKGRIIDVSPKVADSLGFRREGIGHVEIQALLPSELADSLNKLLNPNQPSSQQTE
jgi:rare lipoprotein A